MNSINNASRNQDNNNRTTGMVKESIIKEINKMSYDNLLALTSICQAIDCGRDIDPSNYSSELSKVVQLIKWLDKNSIESFEYIYDFICSKVLSVQVPKDLTDDSIIVRFFENFDKPE